jgi:hypothetical protein
MGSIRDLRFNHRDDSAELHEVTFSGTDLDRRTVFRRFHLDVHLIGFNFEQRVALFTLAPWLLIQRRIRTSSLSSLDPRRGTITSFFIKPA